MRNLKRTLSLFLAVIMIFGVMQMAFAVTSYAELTDKEEIVNKDAVALLVDLGIIDGMPDGTYSPTLNVDRASMAKLITIMLLGDVDANAFKGVSTDLTDINGTWAEGYIKFCYGADIIAGRGDGRFDPTANVTVVEAAKMLDVALGYNAETQGYVNNTNWAVNIMRDAATSSITDNVTKSATQTLDRDNAALMIYNTLFAKEVTYNGIITTGPSYRMNTLGLSVYGLVKVKGEITKVGKDSVDLYVEDEPELSGTYDVAGVGYDAVGKQGVVYAKYTTTTKTQDFITSVYANKFSKLFSSEVVVNDNVLYTSHDGTTFTKLTSGNDKKVSLDSSVTYYVNGADETAANATAMFADVGTVVEFIDIDENGKADVVKVTEYTAEKVVAYISSGDTSASFSISGYFTKANISGFDSIKNGMHVSTVEYNKMLYVCPTTSIDGKITKFANSGAKITVGGKQYQAADYSNVTFSSSNIGDSKTFHLDVNGYVIATADIDSEKDPYLLVLGADTVNSAVDTTQKAKVILQSGKVQTITVASTDKATSGTYKEPSVAGYAVAANEVYTYTVDNGEYTLTLKAAVNGGANITKNVATVGSATANKSTIYVDVVNEKAYTGYDNVPSFTSVAGNQVNYYYAVNSNGIVAVVFIKSGEVSIADDQFVIYDVDYDSYKNSSGNIVRTYNAIVNGVVSVEGVLTTIDIQENVLGGNLPAGVYKINTQNSSNVVTSATLQYTFDSVTAGAMTKPSYVGGGVVSWNGIGYAMTDDTKVFYINRTTSKANATISDVGSVSDGVFVYVTAKGSAGSDASTAKYIYIINAQIGEYDIP